MVAAEAEAETRKACNESSQFLLHLLMRLFFQIRLKAVAFQRQPEAGIERQDGMVVKCGRPHQLALFQA